MAILCWTTAILGPKTASLPLSQSHTITYIAIAIHFTFLFHICSVRSIIQSNIFTLRTIVQQDPKTMYSLPFRICCSHIFAVATYLLPIICCCHIIFLLPLMCWCHIVCCYPGFVVAAHRNVHKFSFLFLSLSPLKSSKCKTLHQSHIVELPQVAESASVYFSFDLYVFASQQLLSISKQYNFSAQLIVWICLYLLNFCILALNSNLSAERFRFKQ